MSFWTPYSEDGVLDLSRRGGGGFSVKTERLSPREACSAEPPTGYPAAADLRGSSSASPHRPALVPASPLARSPDSTASSLLYGERSVSPAWSGGSSPEPRGRAPRPFKAVTRALEGSVGGELGDARYATFREAMLAAVRARNGGSLCVSNPRMRRAVRRSHAQQHDDDYLHRRARNNAAAKKSRDLRRLKEDELAIRTAFLEAENQRLRTELDALQRQLGVFQPPLHV